MREKFWDLPLAELSHDEWEALCDRCGKCCLIKLEDDDNGDIYYTNLICKLFDQNLCHCSDYANRKTHVTDCLTLTMESLPNAAHWLPESCAYLRRFRGQALPDWHPLRSGDDRKMHEGQHSVMGKTQSETVLDREEDAIHHIAPELGP